MIIPDDNHSTLALTDVGLRIDGRPVLCGVDWALQAGENWGVLGPNRGGKSPLVAVAWLHRHPSSGTVDVLGSRLGQVDIRRLRPDDRNIVLG